MKLVTMFGAVLVSALAMAGCNQEGAIDPSAVVGDSAAELDATSPDADSRPARGPGGMFQEALADLNLTDEQSSTIKAAFADLRTERAAVGEARLSPFAALAASVRAGNVDVEAIEAQRPKFGQSDKFVKALDTLHATLTPEQRQALVDKIGERAERGFGEHGPRGERGPRGAQAEGQPRFERGERGPRAERGDRGERGPRAERGDRRGRGGPMGFLLAGLDLTDEQNQAIEEARAKAAPTEAEAQAQPVDREAMEQRFEAKRAEMKTRLQSFATDSFDARSFLQRPEGAERIGRGHGPDRMLRDLAVVVPILTAAQRETLATRLEQGPAKHRQSRGAPNAAPQGE